MTTRDDSLRLDTAIRNAVAFDGLPLTGRFEAAFAAVLDLHKPQPIDSDEPAGPQFCPSCIDDREPFADYPCPTIRALAKELRVSGEGRSEPTPAPRRQWAVEHPDVITTAHNSEWSVLYTLSKLPGGRIVVRDAPDQPWRSETACLCVTVPDTGHYAGCPDTSEVVTPEGTS